MLAQVGVAAVLVALTAHETAAIECYECTGAVNCRREKSAQWTLGECRSSEFCYQFVENGNVWQRGCMEKECADIPSFVEGDTDCRPCRSDLCNNEMLRKPDNGNHGHRDPQESQGGGGSQYKGAAAVGATAAVLVTAAAATLYTTQ